MWIIWTNGAQFSPHWTFSFQRKINHRNHLIYVTFSTRRTVPQRKSVRLLPKQHMKHNHFDCTTQTKGINRKHSAIKGYKNLNYCKIKIVWMLMNMVLLWFVYSSSAIIYLWNIPICICNLLHFIVWIRIFRMCSVHCHSFAENCKIQFKLPEKWFWCSTPFYNKK